MRRRKEGVVSRRGIGRRKGVGLSGWNQTLARERDENSGPAGAERASCRLGSRAWFELSCLRERQMDGGRQG